MEKSNIQNIYKNSSNYIITIYEKDSHRAVCSGFLIDEMGSFMTIMNPFQVDKGSLLDRSNSQKFYAKILGKNEVYQFKFNYALEEENIMIGQLISQEKKFTIPFLDTQLNLCDLTYIFGKNTQNINVVEDGIVNEIKFDTNQILGYNTSSFNIMVNVKNNQSYLSLSGGPLINDKGNVVGMIAPTNHDLLSTHLLAIPVSHLQPIIHQFQLTGSIRRPYLGISIQNSSHNDGAFILKINSDSPAAKSGIRLGETIVEINGNPVNSTSEYFKYIGYNLQQAINLKLQRNGTSRYIQVQPI